MLDLDHNEDLIWSDLIILKVRREDVKDPFNKQGYALATLFLIETSCPTAFQRMGPAKCAPRQCVEVCKAHSTPCCLDCRALPCHCNKLVTNALWQDKLRETISRFLWLRSLSHQVLPANRQITIHHYAWCGAEMSGWVLGVGCLATCCMTSISQAISETLPLAVAFFQRNAKPLSQNSPPDGSQVERKGIG